MLKTVLSVNGVERRMVLNPEVTLTSMLRNQLNLTGTKEVKGNQTLTSAVMMDGILVNGSQIKMRDVKEDTKIITIEGIVNSNELHPVQIAWMAYKLGTCGYCTPNFIVAAKCLLEKNTNPKREEIESWFSQNGNHYHCEEMDKVIEATLDAASIMRGEFTWENMWKRARGCSFVSEDELYSDQSLDMVRGGQIFATDMKNMLPEGTLFVNAVTLKPGSNLSPACKSEIEEIPGIYQVISLKNTILVLSYQEQYGIEGVKILCKELDGVSTLVSNQNNQRNGIECPECNAGYAYIDEKGKLVVNTNACDIEVAELAAELGLTKDKLVLRKLTGSDAVCGHTGVTLTKLLGSAAMASKKTVYMELTD